MRGTRCLSVSEGSWGPKDSPVWDPHNAQQRFGRNLKGNSQNCSDRTLHPRNQQPGHIPKPCGSSWVFPAFLRFPSFPRLFSLSGLPAFSSPSGPSAPGSGRFMSSESRGASNRSSSNGNPRNSLWWVTTLTGTNIRLVGSVKSGVPLPFKRGN